MQFYFIFPQIILNAKLDDKKIRQLEQKPRSFQIYQQPIDRCSNGACEPRRGPALTTAVIITHHYYHYFGL